MIRIKPFRRGWADALRWVACGLLVGGFLWTAAQFYLPGQGFTYLIMFGDRQHARFIPELKAVNHYEIPNSAGYDSQWYAQIAMHPRLSDPILRKAVDSLPYRARRILFCWTAWAAGGGDPVRTLNAYAFQNIACWVLLAALLFRWLPPSSWGNVARWSAILLSFGLAFSVKGALVDGPSVLLIAAGIALIESGRPWAGSALLGLSGLGRETNVLAAAAIPLPSRRTPREWGRFVGQGLLVALPVVAWVACLNAWLGQAEDVGARNLAFPLAGFVNKAASTASELLAEGWPLPPYSFWKFDALVLVGLLVQFLFFTCRIRWRDPWWRVGAAYCCLMAILGEAVWENYPSAAARVLLPMAVAFNLTVPRGRLWFLVLVAGNLGIAGSFDVLNAPGRETFTVRGPAELRISPVDGHVVEAVFLSPRGEWYPAEKSRLEFWRWNRGPAEVALRNPHAFPIAAEVTFSLRSNDARGATVLQAGRVLWSGTLAPGRPREVRIADLRMPPGDTVLRFETDRPAAYPGGRDTRPLALSVRNLNLKVSVPGAPPAH